jgi:hypothetical protein
MRKNIASRKMFSNDKAVIKIVRNRRSSTDCKLLDHLRRLRRYAATAA